jgi:hypothetical protein
MTNQIDNSIAIQFSDQVHVNGQQMKTRLRDKVDVVPMSTGDMTVETLDSLEAIEITSRHQKTQGQDIVHGRRRIRMREFRTTIYLDEKDELSTLINPEKQYSAAVAKSMYRSFDRIVIQAGFDPVYTGKDMTTVLTAAQDGVISIDATAGSTYEKLLELHQSYMDYEIGTELEEDFYLCVSGDEWSDFMQETELTSGDFVTEKPIDGKKGVTKVAGIELIKFGGKVSNPLLPVASSVRDCLSFASGGIKVGLTKDVQVFVDIRPDLNRAKQVQAVQMIGATRTEGSRVRKYRTTVTA